VTASDACPEVCNEECIVNCDNDGDWVSTTGADCAAVASDPDTLCSEVDSAGVSASDACPASCNVECYEPLVPVPVPVATPMPTEFVTVIATSESSEGGTVTVSTETTGPPTVELRDGERR